MPFESLAPSSQDLAAAGIAHWRGARLQAGAQGLLDQLAALRATLLAHAADPAWICLADDAQWAAQITLLVQRLGELQAGPAAADAALQARYPLLGVPFAVKDNIDIAGVPTTAACPAFAFTPTRHATVVQRLLDAGALWVGKTNLDQFATGLVGTRSPYGRPASVADATRISGGSSAGSAVAVARGWAAFALGTDTAGSGRVPAGFNGLVGLKPTVGRVSTAGVLPACRTLDCVSVFARSPDDAAAVLAVLEGEDPADPYSLPLVARVGGGAVGGAGAAVTPLAGAARLPATARVAVPLVTPWFGDAGYEAAWARACDALRASGAQVQAIDFEPLHEVASLLYHGPWVAERHAVVQALMDSNPAALDPVVLQVIARARDFSATDAFRAQYQLRAMRHKLQALWRDFDLLLVPTAPGHPTFAEIDADPVGVNTRMGTWTNFVNLLGWCALALPAGHTDRGLPFGVTAIGPAGADAALLHWAGATPAAGQAMPRSRPTMPLAVVGAHLSGLPLNSQLTERGATLRQATHTAAQYRLYALPGTVPPKPGLKRVGAGEQTQGQGGHAIALEVWDMPVDQMGSFLALIPPPLGLGSIELADGQWVHGFLCESHALATATDISTFGGWRAWLASRQAGAASPAPVSLSSPSNP